MSAGRPSETALRIAANRVAAVCDPDRRPLLLHPDEPYSRWFLQEISPTLLRFWTWAPTRRWLQRAYESRTPGVGLYLLLRKRWIEERVRGLLGEVEQVVALGAGFDPLCLRLAAERPDVQFFELDHPDTQKHKRRALHRHNLWPPNLTLTPIDLATESLDRCLGELEGYSAERRSLFLVEGLLPYLAPEEARRALETASRLSGPASVFVMSFLDRVPRSHSHSEAARMAAVVARLGEPFRFETTRTELPDFLRGCGLQLEKLVDARELERLYLDGRSLGPVFAGELLVTAYSLGGRERRRASPEARIRPRGGTARDGRSLSGSQ